LETKVTDARGVSKTKVLNLHVLQDGILIAADGERDAPLGRLFNHTFTATGGAGAYKWSTQRGGVPGLHLDSATGTLSGTPTAEGKFQLAVEARDQNGAWVVHSFYLNVHRVVAADGPPVASPEASQTRAGNQDTRKFETAPSAPPYTLPMLVKGSPSPVHEQVNLEKLPLPAARSLLIPPATPLVSVSLPEFVLDRTLDGHSGWVTGLAFTADGRRLAASRSDQTVKFWDVATGQELGSVGSDMKGIQALAFSHDGHFLAAESTSDDVALWDAATGRELRTLPGSGRSGFLDSGSWVYSIAFSPDGRWLASGEDDRTVRLWEVKTGRPAHDLAGLRRPVICMAFSPDGRWLATGDGDKTIGIWDVAIGREIRKLRGHTKDVYAVAFSPDGRWLASASGDKCVKLWDFSSGREVYTLTSHRNSVTSLAFSPDSRWLASGSWDKTVKIWDSTTGGVVQTLTGHTNHVYAIAVDSSGRWLASGSEDGTIKLWRLREPQLKN
jgi:WD40 repeat protein